jgi:hypothetical protein
MTSAELNIIHCGYRDVDLETPDVYPASRRPTRGSATSENLGHGLCVPQKSPTFPRTGTVVLRWCSAVSERSVPAGADECLPAR